jgi:hypothetical protein
VSASRVLYLTRCLASKVVFGSIGFVLESSMALIPTETILIFHGGKIHRFKLYCDSSLEQSIINYQLIS